MASRKPCKTERFIYVLELEDECMYIGQTSDPETRFEAHRDGKGAAWTRLHAMRYVRDIRPAVGEPGLDEDYETRKWMFKRGIDKVRGGAYSKCVLYQEERQQLEKEQRHARNACLGCGALGHYIQDCPRKKTFAHLADKKKRDATFRKTMPPVVAQSTWDAARMHQHLELSESSRTVATTGFHGYGAVVAHGCATAWTVEVRQLGTGGFALGVIEAAASGPFKSLASRADAWVWQAHGGIFHCKKKTPAPGYGQGDLLTVRLLPGVMHLTRNGRSAATVPLPPGTYALCCQPFKHGVARLG